MRTDARGRLLFLLPPAREPLHHRYLEFRAHRYLPGTPDYRRVVRPAICDLSADFLPGTTFDFGPLTFDGGPVLVQGIVVDQAGTPIPDVAVSCTPQAVHGSAAGKRQDVATAGDGTFEFRGLTPHASLHLVAKHKEFIGKVITVPTSSRQVRLVLQRAGSLGIRCVPGSFEHLWKRGRLALILEREVGQFKKQIRHKLKTPESVVPNLDPGAWDVTLTLHGFRLARFPKIQISPGEVARPVFLQGLSLASLTHVLTIRVVDENSAPRRGVGLVLSATHAGSRYKTPRYSTNAKGEETYVVPVAFAEITVLPSGGKPVRIPNTGGTQVLTVPKTR